MRALRALALAGFMVGSAGVARAAEPVEASADECAVMAEVMRTQYEGLRGKVPLRPEAASAAPQDAVSPAIRAEEEVQYLHDYFPGLAEAERQDMGRQAGVRREGYRLDCAWGRYGLALTGKGPVLSFQRPLITADRLYAFVSNRYASAAVGNGGSDCLLEKRDGAWRVLRCTPR